MKRIDSYESHKVVCQAIGTYPRMMTCKDIASETGLPWKKVKMLIEKFPARYLLSEAWGCGEPVYFFSYSVDKAKTLELIEERIKEYESE